MQKTTTMLNSTNTAKNSSANKKCNQNIKDKQAKCMDPSVLKRSNFPAIAGADRIRPIGCPSAKRINKNNWMSGNACNIDNDQQQPH